IALALRLNVEIRISESLLNEIAIPMDSLPIEDDFDSENNELTKEEKLAEIEASLAKALADENYEEAAKLRDLLNQLPK
ncbi:MAG: hypothetical protein RLZZ44_568, partial [Bacteroidota bacterium]